MNEPAAARSIARPPATEPVKLRRGRRSPAPSMRLGLLVAEDEVLEQALRADPPRSNAIGETLAGSRVCAECLRMHRIAGHQRRNDGVDRREVGIVPRRDHQHHAERLAA